MTATEIIPQPNLRLNRIKLVCRVIRGLIAIGVLIMLLAGGVALLQSVLALLGGKTVPGQSMSVHLSFSPNQSYVVPADAISWPVQLLGAMHFCLLALGFIVLNRLLKLYERSCFFTANNVRFIKMLGLIVAGNGLTQVFLEFLSPQRIINPNQLVFGLLILLIAWIMDEGRKLQEEQELTV